MWRAARRRAALAWQIGAAWLVSPPRREGYAAMRGAAAVQLGLRLEGYRKLQQLAMQDSR